MGFRCLAVVSLAIFPALNSVWGQEASSAPRITFTKTLKGSLPEYMALSLDTTGSGTYDSHKLDDTGSPRPLQISAATTARIFALADSLNDFRSLDLDTHRKVANMGLKTLTYESGKETHRVQYNFTENRAGAELTGIFEKISNVEEEINQLEYAMKYDHLALAEDLSEIQDGLVDNSYVEPALMVPTLQKISSNSRYLHLAQTRAQEIMQRIQASN